MEYIHCTNCHWIGVADELYNATPNERHPAYQSPDVCPECHSEDIEDVDTFEYRETWKSEYATLVITSQAPWPEPDLIPIEEVVIDPDDWERVSLWFGLPDGTQLEEVR